MKRDISYMGFLLAAVILTTCKIPYTPTPVETNYGYLVVEGFINISDSTYINLSRTVTVSAASTTKPELKATVTIENDTGGSYPLLEIGSGRYGAPNYNLSASGQYRVRIKTSNGKTYLSNLVPTSIAPPIDTLAWKDEGNGVRISISAHNSQGTTRYYRWDYTETWEIYTFVISNFIYTNGQLLPRTAAQQVHHCWGYENNPNILLASTATLSQDIIPDLQLEFIPIGNEKLSNKWTTLVKQYALTKDAYDYYSLLKKNTEQLGSIFDAQPSASIGNINCLTTPAEPVIGYISAGTVSTSKRIFIDRFTQLPYAYYFDYFTYSPYNQFKSCDTITATAGLLVAKPEVVVPLGTLGGNILAVKPPGCADCSINGSTTQPSFWK